MFVLQRFPPHLLVYAPSWSVSGVSCYLRLLSIWRFSVAIALFNHYWSVLVGREAHWPREVIGPELLVWTWCVYSPYSLIFLVVLLCLLEALAELIRIGFPAIGMSYNCQTSGVVWKSYLIPIPLLFDWSLFLFTTFICIVRGDDIINLRQRLIHITWLLTCI